VKRTRWLAGAGGLALVATLFATPAAAQSVNRAAIDELNTQLLYVALPLALFVEVTLIYAIYRFRNNDDPSPTVDDPGLEITWTAATAVILVFVGVSAYFTMANPYLTPATMDDGDGSAAADAPTDDMIVEVEAYQWGWAFHYPDANVTTRDRLTIPADRDVRLVLSSRDVIHSIYVPALGIKQDVIPGTETVARTRATETGEYRLYCAELCGDGHARMGGQVAVLNETAYEEWEDDRAAS
jgi:cytochrome c oxidase subunit 2